MSDEIRVTGEVNLVEIAASLHHAVEEMGRIGRVVADGDRDNSRKFADLTAAVNDCKSELKQEISDLSTAQKLTEKDFKMLAAKVSAVVASAITVLGVVLKYTLPFLAAL